LCLSVKASKNSSKIKKVGTLFGVDEYRLPNGLRVLYRHEVSAPVVAVCVTYHVGSRNEASGHTGSTHILEHLLFKDSEHFRKETGREFATYFEWLGAQLNATTLFDRTNYFEMLPAEFAGDAIAGEADRMLGALFTDADLASEMTVVRNEYERGRNNPFELLDEEIMATAFTKHPYRIPTIGSKEDIENSTAKKLREFYNTYYWPNNATLTVVGDIPWKKAEALIQKFFGPVQPSPHKIPEMRIVEPPQKSPKSVSLQKKMGVSIASLYYKVPSATHKDFPALMAACVILGGGFSSRFQKALVDTGLAADASASVLPLRDPGVAMMTAHVAQKTPKAVLVRMRKEVEAFANPPAGGGPTAEELARAKERLLSQFAQERDGVMGEIRIVSEAVAAGDWTLAYRLEMEIAKLTPAAVWAAAKKYLHSKGETAGTLTNK
jgi:zinc protease